MMKSVFPFQSGCGTCQASQDYSSVGGAKKKTTKRKTMKKKPAKKTMKKRKQKGGAVTKIQETITKPTGYGPVRGEPKGVEMTQKFMEDNLGGNYATTGGAKKRKYTKKSAKKTMKKKPAKKTMKKKPAKKTMKKKQRGGGENMGATGMPSHYYGVQVGAGMMCPHMLMPGKCPHCPYLGGKRHMKGGKSCMKGGKSCMKGGFDSEKGQSAAGKAHGMLSKFTAHLGSDGAPVQSGGGSDWLSTHNSRGPSSYPNQPSKKNFGKFADMSQYIPNTDLACAAAPMSSGCIPGPKAGGYQNFAAVGGAKKKTMKKKSAKKTMKKKSAKKTMKKKPVKKTMKKKPAKKTMKKKPAKKTMKKKSAKKTTMVDKLRKKGRSLLKKAKKLL